MGTVSSFCQILMNLREGYSSLLHHIFTVTGSEQLCTLVKLLGGSNRCCKKPARMQQPLMDLSTQNFSMLTDSGLPTSFDKISLSYHCIVLHKKRTSFEPGHSDFHIHVP